MYYKQSKTLKALLELETWSKFMYKFWRGESSTILQKEKKTFVSCQIPPILLSGLLNIFLVNLSQEYNFRKLDFYKVGFF